MSDDFTITLVTDPLDMPTTSKDIWRKLKVDIMLRLEQTPAGKWLKVEFEDADTMRRARAALIGWTSRTYGSGLIRTRGEDSSLFVTRGEKYYQRTGTKDKNRRGH